MGISINTLILIEDIQLRASRWCLAILALQQWSNSTVAGTCTVSWLYCAGAIIDLVPGQLAESQSGTRFEPMTFPLSYALLNVALCLF